MWFTELAGNQIGKLSIAPGFSPAIMFGPMTRLLPGDSFFPLTLSTPAPAGGLLVSVASSDTSVVAVTPTVVFIPAGAIMPVRREPVLSALNLGQVTITATAPGYRSSAQTVMVGIGVAFAPQAITLTVTSFGSVQGRPTLTISAPAPAGGLDISIASDNPQVAIGPSTVSIPAGSQNVVVPITPKSAGTTTIRATSSSFVDAAALDVTVTVQ